MILVDAPEGLNDSGRRGRIFRRSFPRDERISFYLRRKKFSFRLNFHESLGESS